MPLSVNESGRFSISAAVSIEVACASLFSSATSLGLRVASFWGVPGPCCVMPNQTASLSAASRTEQCSMIATKSSTLPPDRPPRAATQLSDLHDHAPLLMLTQKLGAPFEVCVGNGQTAR